MLALLILALLVLLRILLPIQNHWLLLRSLRRVHERSRRWVVSVTSFPPPVVLSLPLLLLHRICRHRDVSLSCVKPSPLLGGRSPAHAHHVPMHVFLCDQIAFAAACLLRRSPSPSLTPSFRRMHHVPQRGCVQSPGRCHGHAACCGGGGGMGSGGGGGGAGGGGGGGHSASTAARRRDRHRSPPWPLAAWLPGSCCFVWVGCG